MGGLFDKPKGPEITPRDKAELDLRIQRDRTSAYREKLEKTIDREREIAKQLFKEGKKERGLLVLKKRKSVEKLLESADGMMDKLEELIAAIDFAKVESEFVVGLEKGKDVLRDLQEETSVERVEDLLEENEEAMAYFEEMDGLMKENLDEEDEAEAFEEYKKLLEEVEQGSAITLPDVPKDPLPHIPESQVETVVKKKKKKKEALVE